MNRMSSDFAAADETAADRAVGRLIVLELNELCPHLLERWMADGSLPNFRRLHTRSDVFVTRADVEDAALLEPWIQWYSVHTGLPYSEHKVFHLTEGRNGGHRDIFALLRATGRRVASMASMNLAPFAEAGSLYVGDPWSEEGDAVPSELNAYNSFVSHQVREYSNAAERFGLRDAARFLSFMASHGLSAATIAGILRQLASEKLSRRPLGWRRVAVLDALQADVFAHYHRRLSPHFATFFANSVAHLQHSYWRHMDPEPFSVRPGPEEMAAYGEAIHWGYRAMDRIVGRVLKLAEAQGATVMFLTALSQQPFLRHEEFGGQHFHRLHSVERFFGDLGLAPDEVSPTMTHQYLARFGSAELAQSARARLAALRLEDGREVFGFPAIDAAPGALYFGCQIAARTPLDTPVRDASTGMLRAFGELFYRIDAIKSGRHHPDGCLWIETGRHRLHEHRPSILDVLPTQLEMLGVPVPQDLPGQSLAPVLAI
jgi:hypothetical protein